MRCSLPYEVCGLGAWNISFRRSYLAVVFNTSVLTFTSDYALHLIYNLKTTETLEVILIGLCQYLIIDCDDSEVLYRTCHY
jgi:hypothetical protein